MFVVAAQVEELPRVAWGFEVENYCSEEVTTIRSTRRASALRLASFRLFLGREWGRDLIHTSCFCLRCCVKGLFLWESGDS